MDSYEFIKHNVSPLIYLGLFIITLIAYILLVVYLLQPNKNNKLITSSYVLLVLPIIALVVKLSSIFYFKVKYNHWAIFC